MYYKKLCREQVLERIDLIIEGKKKKSLSKLQSNEGSASEPELDRETLIQNEIDRKVKAATASHLIQIPTGEVHLKLNFLNFLLFDYLSLMFLFLYIHLC